MLLVNTFNSPLRQCSVVQMTMTRAMCCVWVGGTFTFFNVFCEKIPFGEFSHVFVGLFWVDSDVRIFSQLGFYDRRRACRASADVEREVSCVREMNATTVTAFS